ncbi:hypothetical protein CERZMDRAFT_110803 [Cercospora zeae-maydis SCOH1-5]|uniref:Uncharacterized protein n=1 Tax=Cercospora zeae-maydis SCOH1-5 TaxID=717836 RepID=A0A6A6FM30_9PEZI|nr:hypothetical protein CERZMDRAFT_110803 [Cercospora zeae-maydis SCOH1-5]
MRSERCLIFQMTAVDPSAAHRASEALRVDFPYLSPLNKVLSRAIPPTSKEVNTSRKIAQHQAHSKVNSDRSVGSSQNAASAAHGV